MNNRIFTPVQGCNDQGNIIVACIEEGMNRILKGGGVIDPRRRVSEIPVPCGDHARSAWEGEILELNTEVFAVLYRVGEIGRRFRGNGNRLAIRVHAALRS